MYVDSIIDYCRSCVLCTWRSLLIAEYTLNIAHKWIKIKLIEYKNGYCASKSLGQWSSRSINISLSRIVEILIVSTCRQYAGQYLKDKEICVNKLTLLSHLPSSALNHCEVLVTWMKCTWTVFFSMTHGAKSYLLPPMIPDSTAAFLKNNCCLCMHCATLLILVLVLALVYYYHVYHDTMKILHFME